MNWNQHEKLSNDKNVVIVEETSSETGNTSNEIPLLSQSLLDFSPFSNLIIITVLK